MGRLSVVEAAARLGVHPQRIHQRIRDGSLPAERVGHQWSVDDRDLVAVRRRGGAGRPLSVRSAWALVAVAAGDVDLSRWSESERSRARTRLRALVDLASSDDLDAVSAAVDRALRNRARRALFVAAAADLPDLRADARVQLSGVSLPEARLSAGEMVEGYVSAAELGGLEADYFLVSPADRHRANIVLHVIQGESEGLVFADAPRSPLVLAADLTEHDGIRERNEAVDIVARLAAAGD